MEDHPQNSKTDKLSNRAMHLLATEYISVGKRRVHPFYSWLIIGIVTGAAATIVFVANRSGQFVQSSASTAAPTIAVTMGTVTTLAAETSNNTSAADSFPGCEKSTVTNGQCVNNGDLKASNVSKVDIHTLLPALHKNAKVYETYIPFWGPKSHPDIGYSSADPAQVTKELSDLTSRGFDGIIDDWFGPGSAEETATEVLKAGIDKQSALTFSLMLDQGYIKRDSCYPNCTATQAVLTMISFARSKGYFSDPHYQLENGKPVVYEFGFELYPIDWIQIEKADPDIKIVWENAGGFTKPDTLGAFIWPNPIIYSQAPAGFTDVNGLSGFYVTALNHQNEMVVGGVWKGFDDTVASWSPAPYNVAGTNGGRRIAQNCGQTWLDTWNALGSYGGRLDAVQVDTWDDYEEGTEIQSGIDNCLSISDTISGKTLSWSIAGQENTLDHYNVYISKNGSNLAMLQKNISASARSLDLSKYNIPAGSYTLYVEAIGKPSIVNHMASAVHYSVASPPPPPAPVTKTPSCKAQPLRSGSVSPTTVAKGGTYTVHCDYGFTGPGIWGDGGTGTCTWSKFTSGTVANFTCKAGSTAGTFKNNCIIDQQNTGNYCLETNAINSITIK